ncbi:MAG: rhodanese-like domain-containing protein [Rhodanobacter sp.]|jgi:thiosulfate/3-mercaptopyruvate sulfurtransferase|nr:rhodanese-like domain-containing protein [Rhodanobacter sp.]
MKMLIKSALIAALVLVGSTAAQAIELPGPVVSPQWLLQHQTEVNIVDVRSDPASFTKAPAFTTEKGVKSLSTLGGHIPGALFLDFGKVRVPRMVDAREINWMLPDQQAFQNLMRSIGVKAGLPTVIVPEGASGADLDMAARVYWSMKVYGDDKLALLDGGTTGWLQQGLAYNSAPAPSAEGNWVATPARMRYVASSADVAKAIGTKAQIVDARPMPFYVGLVKKPNVGAAGHIKGAVNLPPELRTTMADGSEHYLKANQYKAIFKHLDLNAAKPSITYCNTGHLAAGAWFVLSEVLKNPHTRLYDGSMYEWTTEQRPVVGLP